MLEARRRTVLYGYRYTEVALDLVAPDFMEIKPGVPSDPSVRPAMSVSLGCHVEGAALPHPDLSDTDTTIAGATKRIASALPDPDPGLLVEFEQFVKDYVSANYVPLSPDTDLTIETWLSKTHYPEWRKEELRTEWARASDPLDPKYRKVKGFGKDEDYEVPKHTRGIHSRDDVFKCLVGPMFKAIEEVVYKDPHFIKHVPVADRPAYIKAMLEQQGVRPFTSDYTSFEAMFREEVMNACEFVLYFHMSQFVPEGPQFRDICVKALAGQNACSYKTFNLLVMARRMSGEMCTSLGNGFTNLMLYLFLAKKAGATEVRGVVEGDDGLFITNGPAPTPEDFARLGASIKLAKAPSLEAASFCGLIFDPTDLVNIANPLKVVTQFGWGCARYAGSSGKKTAALLRCKALSLAHQYPGCPVIQSLAQYGLRATSDVKMCKVLRAAGARGGLDEWKRLRAIEAIRSGVPKPAVVPMRTRCLMEDVFGLSVTQQLRIEKYLDGLTQLQPLSIDLDLFPVEWTRNWDTYVRKADVFDRRPDLAVAENGLNVWNLLQRVTPGTWRSWQVKPGEIVKGTIRPAPYSGT